MLYERLTRLKGFRSLRSSIICAYQKERQRGGGFLEKKGAPSRAMSAASKES
jgi:hypothetical protein